MNTTVNEEHRGRLECVPTSKSRGCHRLTSAPEMHQLHQCMVSHKLDVQPGNSPHPETVIQGNFLGCRVTRRLQLPLGHLDVTAKRLLDDSQER